MAAEPLAVARNALTRRLPRWVDEAGVLSCDGHDARDDDDLYGLERRAAIGLRQLLSSDPTGRARNGLSPAQHALVLADVREFYCSDERAVCGRRRADRRMDVLSALERHIIGGAGAGGGRRSVADQHRDFLPGLVSGLDQFHRHDALAADERDVADENAPDLLGMVHDGLHLAASVSGLVRRGTVALPGSQLRDEFLQRSEEHTSE